MVTLFNYCGSRWSQGESEAVDRAGEGFPLVVYKVKVHCIYLTKYVLYSIEYSTTIQQNFRHFPILMYKLFYE